ncbi:MAG TPA: class I SAM-dependent methyltransferase [Thermodesulfobacteriota bacterium]|nr:class I SAM-dependent methyltransferase [Thermodesulfobacteriota bacterium]
MERIPEPEIMGAEDEAKVYDLADFSEVNQEVANRVLELVPQPSGVLLDCGCGPGDILMRIHTLAPEFFLIGVDGSIEMLILAVARMRRLRLHQKICFVQGDVKELNFSANTFDVVISNSLVHHLIDPFPLWKEAQRVIKPGGTILFRDLSRPSTPEVARDIVEKYSGTEPQLLKDLFFQSLKASFTVAEIKTHLIQAGIYGLEVKMCSDRHWEVAGKMKK